MGTFEPGVKRPTRKGGQQLWEARVINAALFVAVMSLLFFALWLVGAVGPELFYR
jgi:hypothetical protein